MNVMERNMSLTKEDLHAIEHLLDTKLEEKLKQKLASLSVNKLVIIVYETLVVFWPKARIKYLMSPILM